jgi:RNA polymerase sigma factor (sigma-70 family)
VHQHPPIPAEPALPQGRAHVNRARLRVVSRSDPDTPSLGRNNADLAVLVRAAAGGDEEAWRLLVRRFTPTLRSAARGFKLPAADVDDVVQSTWLAAFRHVRRLEKPEAFGAWLLVTVRREALRTFQRTVRELVTDEPPSPAAPEEEAADSVVIAKERREAVHAAARRLPQRQQTLVRALLSQRTASYEELSRTLDMPIGSIGPTRERALQRLRSDRHLTAVVENRVG